MRKNAGLPASSYESDTSMQKVELASAALTRGGLGALSTPEACPSSVRLRMPFFRSMVFTAEPHSAWHNLCIILSENAIHGQSLSGEHAWRSLLRAT